MWWPGPTSATWVEAHASAGATVISTTWLVADAFAEYTPNAVGDLRLTTNTYVLIANRSSREAVVEVSRINSDVFPSKQTFTIPPLSRFTIDVSTLWLGPRSGLLIESIGLSPAQLVVEKAIYSDAQGVHWAAGANALATPLN